MAEKRNLRLKEVTFRFMLIAGLVTGFDNPSDLDLMAVMRSPLALWPKLMIGTFYLALMIVLVRQTFCGLRPFFPVMPILLLGIGALLWDYGGFLWASPTTLLVSVMGALCLLATLGHVSAYFIRQVAGQQLVLKAPP